MDAIHCYVTELDDLFSLLKSPCLNSASRAAVEEQCRETLSVMTTACMELELSLAESRQALRQRSPVISVPTERRPVRKIEIDSKTRT